MSKKQVFLAAADERGRTAAEYAVDDLLMVLSATFLPVRIASRNLKGYNADDRPVSHV
jgi:hypothetical protein